MSLCKKCGAEAYPRSTCYDCLQESDARRQIAFNQAITEFGPLTADNLDLIQQRVKELEKE